MGQWWPLQKLTLKSFKKSISLKMLSISPPGRVRSHEPDVVRDPRPLCWCSTVWDCAFQPSPGGSSHWCSHLGCWRVKIKGVSWCSSWVFQVGSKGEHWWVWEQTGHQRFFQITMVFFCVSVLCVLAHKVKDIWVDTTSMKTQEPRNPSPWALGVEHLPSPWPSASPLQFDKRLGRTGQ